MSKCGSPQRVGGGTAPISNRQTIPSSPTEHLPHAGPRASLAEGKEHSSRSLEVVEVIKWCKVLKNVDFHSLSFKWEDQNKGPCKIFSLCRFSCMCWRKK